MNAALANTEGGCPVFISGRLSQAGKEMWATSEHIETAQGSGSKKWLTWKKPEERVNRKNADKKECISHSRGRSC